jgi:hypothetical protein
VRRITFCIGSVVALLAATPLAASASEVVTVRNATGTTGATVAFARSADGPLYALGADGGLSTSMNGLAWTGLSPVVPESAIATDPTDPGSLFVFSVDAVFVSEDHGTSFTRRPVPFHLCVGLECSLLEPISLFALPREGRRHTRELVAFSPLDVLDSTNDGASWTTVEFDGRPATAVAAGRALIETLPDGTARSTDGGRSWKSVAEEGGDAAAVDPGNPLHVVAVGPNISVLSEDGGRTWTRLTGRHPRSLVDDVAIDPVHPLTVWAAAGHALFLSRDGGSNFSRVLDTGTSSRPIRLLGYAPRASQASRARSTIRTVLTSSGDGSGAGVARVSMRSTRPVPRSLPRVIVARWRIGARLQCVPATWTAPTRGPITWRRDGRRLGGHAVARTLGRADLHARLTCEQVAHGRAVRSLPAGPPAVTAVTSVGDFRISQTVLCRGTVVGRSPLVHVDWETGRRILPGDEHTITAADHGKVLRCRISVRNRYGNRIRFGPGHRIA